MKKFYLFFCLLLVGVLAKATTYTWIGTTGTTGANASSGTWSTTTHWSPTAPTGGPTSSDDVIFANTSTAVTVTVTASTACRSITLSGAKNVTLAPTTATTYTITLSGVTGALTVGSGVTLGLQGITTGGGIQISIPTGGTATITGSLSLSPQSGYGSQTSQLLSFDAGSVSVNGTVFCGAGNNAPFGTSSTNNNVVVFNSGSKYTTYTNSNPWGSGMTAPNQISSFGQGSTYQIFGGTGFPSFAGRTLGTLLLSGGNNGTISNATGTTTTVLDSLIITATLGSNVTFNRGSGGTAVPTYSFNNIRISATSTNNTPVVFSNNAVDNATYVISGGVIVNTASAATGNASLTLGSSTVNTSNTTTSITFTGSGKSITTEDQGAGTGVPTIAFATSGTSNTGTKTTNLIIDSTASITLNANLDLTTTNITSNLTVRTKGILSIGSGYTLTTNNKLTLQSSVTGTGSIGNSTGATITGNAIVQRYIPANAAWRTLGLPFTNTYTYTGGTAGSNEISLSYFAGKSPSWAYYYNEAADDGKYGTSAGVNAGWTAIASGTTGVSTRKGLLLYGSRNSAAQTLSGTGGINYGDQAIALSKTANGWNLIANPYPSNISWTSIVNNAENATGILASTTVYRVRPLGGGAYSFSSYTSGSGTGTNGGSDVIENGSSFFVKAAANSVNLTIKEANKTTNSIGSTTGGVSLMGANDNYNSIRINLTGENTFSDDVVFVWGRFSKATEGFDADLDAYDLGASGTHDLSIIGSDNTSYSIFNGADLSKTAETRTYKLGTKNLKIGAYEFSTALPKELDRNNEAYIVDNYLKTATLVKDALVYKFDVSADAASKAEDRFQLDIRKKVIAAPVDAVAVSGKTYLLGNPSSNNKITVRFGQDAQTAKWQLVDLSGRLLTSGALSNVYEGDTRVIDTQALKAGTYLVKIFNDNEQAVVLKWIKY